MAGLVIGTIRAALKTRLDAATMTRSVAVYDYCDDRDAVTQYPCIFIGHADPIEYAVTYGAQGIAQMSFEVEVRTQAADNRSAEKVLDDLLSAGTGATSSLYDAICADRTLGGTCHTLTVVAATPPRKGVANGGTIYWSSTYTVTIAASRS